MTIIREQLSIYLKKNLHLLSEQKKVWVQVPLDPERKKYLYNQKTFIWIYQN